MEGAKCLPGGDGLGVLAKVLWESALVLDFMQDFLTFSIILLSLSALYLRKLACCPQRTAVTEFCPEQCCRLALMNGVLNSPSSALVGRLRAYFEVIVPCSVLCLLKEGHRGQVSL